MVSTTPAPEPTAAHIQQHLIAQQRGWLTTYPHLSVSFSALAELVHQMLTTALAAGRAVNDALVREIVILEAVLADAQAERDEIARESELRETEIIALTIERDKAETRLAELDTPADSAVRR